MRILQLGKFYPIMGGVEKVMYDLVQGLSRKGIICDMLCANFKFKEEIITLNKYAKVYCMPTMVELCATMISPQMIARLRKISSAYDIIHIHHPDPMAALALRLSGYKGKVVLHWHSDIVKQKKLLKFYMPLQNWLIHRADMIIGTSPVYIASSYHLDKVKAKCTYLPIGIDCLAPDEAKVKAIKSLYPNKKIIFSLGRLVHYKGYSYLIDAAKFLDDSFVILIGGSGELQADLLNQIETNNLSGRVKLLGRIDDKDLPAYYGACDLYCLSSIMKTEAFAIVQIEAMSCGKPVVSCNIDGSGVPWVNADGVSGLVVEPKNSKALAGAIRYVLDNQALYQKLSIGAKVRYQEIFTKEKMISKCIELYRQVLI